MSTLQIGSTGSAVSKLEMQLETLGYYTGAIDGDFGPKLQAAVEAFQTAKGLVADGVVGPATQAALGGSPAPANPSASVLYGVDVADNNKSIDWGKVSQNKTFVSIKATEGLGFVNPYFSNFIKYAPASGLYVSPYHFFRPEDDGVAQAKFFLKTVGNFTGLLPGALDWEVSDGVSTTLAKQRALDFLNTVKAATGNCFFYFSADWFDTFGDMSAFNGFNSWIAEYTSGIPRFKFVGAGALFWQYSNTGSCPGINGAVDLDLFYGDEVALKALLLK